MASFLGSVALSRSAIVALTAEVLAALGRWKKFATEAGVTAAQSAEVGATLRQRTSNTLTPLADLDSARSA